ncbi:unnamed protein product [Allacma fusca]|uniref:CRAL-TRIO domain-containing protein n=1 Tax=Allacma fusca TaxID=39272 RepID=A0A8J2LL30_9HEXA|nr:unnamed protein product [Allacma fusca]
MPDEEYLSLFLELQTWDPPKYIQEGFQYKFAGYDKKNRPIWIAAVGKYSIKEVLKRGDADQLERYGLKALIWIIKSIVAKSPAENQSGTVVLIGNFEGYSMFQLLHPPTMAFRYKMAGKYKELMNSIFGVGIAVNMNRISAWLVNLFRPVLSYLDRVEFFGSDESKWRPRLEEIFENAEIPSFDGNHRHFPPIILQS